MPYITVGKENSGDIEIYHKDWGSGAARGLQPRSTRAPRTACAQRSKTR